MKSTGTGFSIFLGSVVVALMMDLYLFVHVFVVHSGTTGGSRLLYPVVLVVAFFVWIMQGKLNSSFYKYVILVGIIFLWYWVCESVSRIEFIKLCATMGCPLFVLSLLKYKTEHVLLFTMLFAIIFVPGLPIYMEHYTQTGEMSMGIGYAILPVIVAGIVHFIYYSRDCKKWIYFLYIVPAFYMAQLFFHGLRGPLASVAFLLFLVRIFQVDEGIGKRKILLNKIYLIVFFSFIVCLFLFLDDVMELLVDWFLQNNINAYFVLKTIMLLKKGDILNGRMELWERAWGYFQENPILGNGFDSFEYYTGVNYPHNFLLQTLFDGGMVAFTAILIFIIIGYKKVIYYGDRDDVTMLIFISGFGVVYPLVSTDMYENSYLWILMGFLLSKGFGPIVLKRERNY